MKAVVALITAFHFLIFSAGYAAEMESSAIPKSVVSVAVISAVGDRVNIYTNGFTFFHQSERDQTLSGFNLDDEIEVAVGKNLGNKFKIEPVKYDREKFSAVIEKSGFKAAGGAPVGELVKTLSSSVDAYLVISKAPVPFGVRDDLLRPGINIGKGAGSTFGMYIFMDVSLFDAHTNSLLAHAVYPPPISRFWGGAVEMLPLNGNLWPNDDGDFTNVQRPDLKTTILTDLDAIISRCLKQMGMSTAN